MQFLHFFVVLFFMPKNWAIVKQLLLRLSNLLNRFIEQIIFKWKYYWNIWIEEFYKLKLKMEMEKTKYKISKLILIKRNIYPANESKIHHFHLFNRSITTKCWVLSQPAIDGLQVGYKCFNSIPQELIHRMDSSQNDLPTSTALFIPR